VLAARIAELPGRARARDDDAVPNLQQVGERGIAAGGGHPHPVLVDLPDLDVLGKGALGRFLPPLGAGLPELAGLHLLGHDFLL
jgi:hypothetical protein